MKAIGFVVLSVALLTWGLFVDPVRAQPSQSQLDTLIEQLGVAGAASNAVTSIELLGCSAVPNLISSIEDFRPFPDQFIQLPNDFRGAFEEFRTYSPDQVVDAIDALLTQATGLFSGFFIFNGGTDTDRAQAIAYWREQDASRTLGRCTSSIYPVPALAGWGVVLLVASMIGVAGWRRSLTNACS